MTPSWILDILAAIMLLVAATSAGRLVVGRAWAGSSGNADIDVAHLLMGIAMAGMLVASLSTLPNDVWDVIFAVLTGWFGWRVYRESGARAPGCWPTAATCRTWYTAPPCCTCLWPSARPPQPAAEPG